MPDAPSQLVAVDLDRPIWERFFTVAPLVVVGTREPDGGYDLAPKHMATPLGWSNRFAFVCTPRHATYRNARREGAFTVSFPRPDAVVLAGLAAEPRCEDGSKPALAALPTVPASVVAGVLLADADLHLECRLERVVDDFGDNSLIAGEVVAARVAERALRGGDRDDREVVEAAPLLAYLAPGRFARIVESFSFPFPAGFEK